MIEIKCDKCGVDCGSNAFDVLVRVVHNPCPLHPLDISELKITDVNEHCRFVLCQKCYREMGLPNVQEVIRTKEIKFRPSSSLVSTNKQRGTAIEIWG